MKQKAKIIKKVLLVLGIAGIAVSGPFLVKKFIEREDSRIEANSLVFGKYNYNEINAQLKSDKALEYAKQLSSGEITHDEYLVAYSQIKDYDKNGFMKDYANEEDYKTYAQASTTMERTNNEAAFCGLGFAVCGGLIAGGIQIHIDEKRERKLDNQLNIGTFAK